jgi:hypothetical protein
MDQSQSLHPVHDSAVDPGHQRDEDVGRQGTIHRGVHVGHLDADVWQHCLQSVLCGGEGTARQTELSGSS